MPARLAEGASRPYLKETVNVVVHSRGHSDFAVELFPYGTKSSRFDNVKSVGLHTAPMRHLTHGGDEGSVGSTTSYILRKGTYCEIVRGGDGSEYLQCAKGKKGFHFMRGPRPKR